MRTVHCLIYSRLFNYHTDKPTVACSAIILVHQKAVKNHGSRQIMQVNVSLASPAHGKGHFRQCLHSISPQVTWEGRPAHESSMQGLPPHTHPEHESSQAACPDFANVCAVCDEACPWSACAQVCEAAASVQGSWRQQPGQCGLSYEGKGVPGEHTTHTTYSHIDCLSADADVCLFVCLSVWHTAVLCGSSAAILSLPVSLRAGDTVCLPVLAS